MTHEPTVYVIDDDVAVRRFLEDLIESVSLRVEAYASAQEFLDAFDPGAPGCVVLDIRMPGMSGLELQRELAERAISLPIIILTGHGDVQIAVRAMRAGAVDFIEKPFNNELLLDSVQKAVAESVDARDARVERGEIESRMHMLTPREHDVLNLIVMGETNKGVARRLGISEKTVEGHRAGMMAKMRAKSLANLVKMVVAVDVT